MDILYQVSIISNMNIRTSVNTILPSLSVLFLFFEQLTIFWSKPLSAMTSSTGKLLKSSVLPALVTCCGYRIVQRKSHPASSSSLFLMRTAGGPAMGTTTCTKMILISKIWCSSMNISMATMVEALEQGQFISCTYVLLPLLWYRCYRCT